MIIIYFIDIARHKKEIEKKELKERVEQWKESITPILKNLQEHDFDIHDYGSRIMDGMEINETKSFSSMVEGKFFLRLY